MHRSDDAVVPVRPGGPDDGADANHGLAQRRNQFVGTRPRYELTPFVQSWRRWTQPRT